MKLSEEQIDALKEVINIGVGKASAVLSEMVASHISLQVPFIRILSGDMLADELEKLGGVKIAAVLLDFKGVFSGSAALVFPPDSASKLVSVLTGEEPGSADLDSVRAGTLTEIGNIVINGVMGSISNILNQQLNYSLPNYTEDDVHNLLKTELSSGQLTVLIAHARFSIEKLQIKGNILLIFEVGSFDALISALDKSMEDES